MQFYAHKLSLSGPMYNVTEPAESGKTFCQFYKYMLICKSFHYTIIFLNKNNYIILFLNDVNPDAILGILTTRRRLSCLGNYFLNYPYRHH